ncbi:hypothetical protein PRIPAC_75194, partial [Pristionchus pacificus]|uniref:Uncharacterized protein n=1 Tax=Pristionchus pacificus TaxID=54126 RepID=A0A2A6CFB5_PRIPA
RPPSLPSSLPSGVRALRRTQARPPFSSSLLVSFLPSLYSLDIQEYSHRSSPSLSSFHALSPTGKMKKEREEKRRGPYSVASSRWLSPFHTLSRRTEKGGKERISLHSDQLLFLRSSGGDLQEAHSSVSRGVRSVVIFDEGSEGIDQSVRVARWAIGRAE